MKKGQAKNVQKTTAAEPVLYDNIDFSEQPLSQGEYDNCLFRNCNFQGGDLAELFFSECRFEGCNLSMAGIAKASFRNVKFAGCKMLGMRFDGCNQFGFAITVEDCNLSHSSFYRTRLKGMAFTNTNLQETDFAECDLTSAVLDHCDLAGAIFDNTILEQADLRTAINYTLDPETNRVKQAKFSLAGVVGLLGRFGIVVES